MRGEQYMAAIKKDELEKLESEYGLEPDGLTYQHRCSRITAYMEGRGDEWKPPEKKEKVAAKPGNRSSTRQFDNRHPLFGKKVLITPMMIPDAKRNLAYDEKLGPEIVVRDYNAGEAIYGKAEDVQRMVGDYEIVNVDRTNQVIAKTTFPKIGTEISIRPGVDLVPVVRGNDHKTGYIWSYPTQILNVVYDDELYKIQVYGLKTLIRQIYPELEPRFANKPMMDYIDGVTLAASIPQTHALLKEHRRKERMAEAAGLGEYGGF
jgi:hypothetical protein